MRFKRNTTLLNAWEEKIANARRISFSSALFFLSFLSYSQINFSSIRFRHFTVEDGLPQSSVTAILQDHLGFMWFGTGDGLARYDGHEFLVFKNDRNDSTSIAYNHVQSLAEDNDGNIWIAFRGYGISVLDPRTGKCMHFKHDEKDSASLSDNDVRCLTKDKKGRIWIGTRHGLNLFLPEKKKFKSFWTRYINGDADCIWYLFADSENKIWTGTYRGGGLWMLDPETGKYTGYFHDEKDPASIGQSYIVSIAEDKNKTLWVGLRDDGLNALDRKTGKFKRYKNIPGDKESLVANDLWADMRVDSRNNLWIGTYTGGLSVYNRTDDKFHAIQHNPDFSFSLCNNAVRAIYEDKGGLIWIGTGNGLDVYDPKKEQFTLYQNIPGLENSISGSEVNSITEDKSGNIWICIANEGVNRINLKTGKVTQFLHDQKNTHSFGGSNVRAVACDSAGNVYVAVFGGSLVVFDEKKETFRKIGGGWLTNLACDEKGNTWVATAHGFYNITDGKTYNAGGNNPYGLKHPGIQFITLDRKKNMWVRGGTTLELFDRHKETFTHYEHDPKIPSSFSKAGIFCVYLDTRDRYWIGTINGLDRFDIRTKNILEHYDISNGFANDFISSILEDEKGNLWMTTNKGIIKFNPGTKEVTNFGTSDGLPTQEFASAAYVDKSGRMYFGSYNGMVAFYPGQIRPNPHRPSILFSGLSVLNKPWPAGGNIAYAKELSLSYSEYLFSIRIAAADFSDPSMNQFKYMLEGFDKDWIELGNKHEITFTNLDPGEYVLKIKAANNSGVWNEIPTELKITVSPPWWKTNLFYGACILFTVSGIYFFIRWREKKLVREKKILEENVDQRTRELKNEKEKVESANQAIMLQKQLIEEKQKEIIDSIRYAQRIQQALMANDTAVGRMLKRLKRMD